MNLRSDVNANISKGLTGVTLLLCAMHAPDHPLLCTNIKQITLCKESPLSAEITKENVESSVSKLPCSLWVDSERAAVYLLRVQVCWSTPTLGWHLFRLLVFRFQVSQNISACLSCHSVRSVWIMKERTHLIGFQLRPGANKQPVIQRERSTFTCWKQVCSGCMVLILMWHSSDTKNNSVVWIFCLPFFICDKTISSPIVCRSSKD